MIILYTNNTKDCYAMERAMKDKGIQYQTCTDIEQMKDLGILACPALNVDGQLLTHASAIQYINNYIGY